MARIHTSFVIFLVLLLGTSIRPASAISWRFPFCYGKCMITCIITYPVPVCAVKCVHDCKSLAYESIEPSDCTMKCATSKCTKISTKDDLRVEEVSSCVDACSTNCSRD